MSNKNKDICGSSSMSIPSGGHVLCLCGQHWIDCDKVPIHYPPHGYAISAAKLSKRIDLAWDVVRTRKAAWG